MASKGTAQIAVLTSGGCSALLGHFILDSTETSPRVALGLTGEDITEQVVKGCSCEADDKWYNLTLTHFKEDKEAEFSVRMTGGDYCCLSSKYLSFTTSSIKTDDEARDHLYKYIKKIPAEQLEACDVLICIGPMETEYFDFAEMQPGDRKKLVRDAPEEGDKYGHSHHYHPENVFGDTEAHKSKLQEQTGSTCSDSEKSLDKNEDETKESFSSWKKVSHTTDAQK